MSHPWYQPAPFFMVRVPALPFSIFTQLAESGHIEDALEKDLEQTWQHAHQACLNMLDQLARHPDVELALLIASPGLHDATQKLHSGESGSNRRAIRAYERLLRYIIRMSSRPTPFGACAGVAFGTFAKASRLQLQSQRTFGLRPDMRWFSTFLTSFEARFLSSLKVQVSPSLSFVGGRGVLLQQHPQGGQNERVWFRMTPLVQKICLYARHPIPYAELKRLLVTDFPHVEGEHIDTFLQTLYQRGLLLTPLLPSDDVEPLGSVLSQLDSNPEASSLVEQVRSLQKTFQSHHNITGTNIFALRQQQCGMTSHFEDVTLQVDTRLSLHHQELALAVGEEAARSAETLLRLGLYPQGLPSLHRARRLFLERYEEQEVPLLDIFCPEGALDGLYQHEMDMSDLPSRQQEQIAARNHVLRSLAMQAVNVRQQQIDLTPDLVNRLSCWPKEQEVEPPSLLDLYMQILATSPQALDQGEWQGFVTLLPLGGRSYRRFLHLYEQDERIQTQVRELWRIDEELNADALNVTLAILPSNRRDLNVMHGPLSSTFVMPINRASPSTAEQTVLPDDVLVSVRAGRFLLRSRTHNKPIRVTQPHMLSFTHLPPVARFLLEASHDGEAFPGVFQWGPAGDLPFVPRLVQGKIIVSLAQWTLTETTLQKNVQELEPRNWFYALQHWRKQWNVPRYVYLLEKEDRLLLDLEHVLMVDLLRQEFSREEREKKQIILQEAPPVEQMIWLQDQQGASYLSEFVIPLIRRTKSLQPLTLPPVLKNISQDERCFLPGQEWLYIKLYLPEGLHNLLLTGPVYTFVQEHRAFFQAWFFMRYHDPQAHIRLRFFVPDGQHRARLLQALLVWSHTCQATGLLTWSTLETYERETERYGGQEAITVIEHVFCAQSEVICALLFHQKGASSLLFEAVYALDRLWADWGYDLTARYQVVMPRLPSHKEPQALREQRKTLLAFLLHPPENIIHIFEQQRPALVRASQAIRHLAQQEALCRSEEDILWHLSHMLCNRLLGTRRASEQDVYLLWAMSLKARYHTAS